MAQTQIQTVIELVESAKEIVQAFVPVIETLDSPVLLAVVFFLFKKASETLNGLSKKVEAQINNGIFSPSLSGEQCKQIQSDLSLICELSSCHRASLFIFHNGGSDAFHRSFKSFRTEFEAKKAIAKSFRSEGKSYPYSLIAPQVADLLNDPDGFELILKPSQDKIDPNFLSDRGSFSYGVFLLLRERKPCGFILLEYPRFSFDKNKSKREDVKKILQKIAAEVN